MLWIILAAAAAATISQAKPIADPTLPPGVQLATFDDLTDNGPIPTLYKGLNWSTALTVIDDDGGRLTVAQSQPYFAGASAQVSPGVTTLDNSTQTFDLLSLYFGCFDTRSLIAVACDFTVTGFQPNSDQHQGPNLYSYVPAGDGTQSPMMEVTPGWDGLNAFYVGVVADDSTAMHTWQVVDNVQYTVHE